MFKQAIQFLYPDLNDHELKKFSYLSLALFFGVGVYWLMRLLKNTVLFKIAFPLSLGWPVGHGRLMQPVAKFWSPFVVVALIFIYSKLIDLFEKHKLFYIFCTIYALIFGTIAFLLGIRAFYGDQALGREVLALIGWVSYFATESFGSLVIALFWSFTVSITTTHEAKKGFPFIIAGAQFGALLGSALTFFAEQIGGIWRLYILATMMIIAIMVVIFFFMKSIPEEELIGNRRAHATEEKKEGFFEGLFSGIWLLVTRPYLLGVLVISTFYDIAGQIVDYQMQAQADLHPAFTGELGFAQFQGIYGIGANALSFIIALIGTRHLIHYFGLRVCLLIFPLCFAGALIGLFSFFYFGNPTPNQLLWATCAVMMITKGLSYAVNNPTKDMMYIPTSKDARFKSKGWIDMFGGRTAKQIGARMSDIFKHNLNELMFFGTLFSLGLIGFWIVAAYKVGKKHAQLIKEGKIIS